MKEQLVFDATDVTSLAHSDSVGAYIRSSDGTQITHTTAGSKEALDVNIAASDIQIQVDLSHTEDSVRLGDGTSFFTSTTENGDIALDVHLSNSNIEVTQGTSPWVIGDGGGSITVDAVDLDIRDLQFATDEVQIGNATGVADFNTGSTTAQTLRVTLADDTELPDAALANTAIASAALTLAAADTAQDVVASPLTNRKYLWIRNMDNKRAYIGASGVSAANGYPLSPQQDMMLRAGAAVDIEFVGSSGQTPEVRTLELS